MAKYPYIINKDGVWYPSGAEVPADKSFKVDNEVIGNIDGDVINVTNEEVVAENQFTKTEINRMSTADLRELASLNGFENVEEMTGSELKKALIEKFDL